MHRRILLAGVGCLLLASLLPPPAVAGTVNGTLRISSANPRYFEDPQGNVVYLAGSHTWLDFQDAGDGFPPAPFDYPEYLAWLVARHHNFTRLWSWEQSRWVTDVPSEDYWFNPGPPYVRTGPGVALDARPRFNLSQLDQAFFDRLRQRVVQARDAGVYVAVMLFDGWSVADLGIGANNPWRGHPFNAGNNVNGLDGDSNHDGRGPEVHTLGNPSVLALQEAYVRKVVDSVNDLDNVLYEICNECNASSTAWQYHMIDLIHSHEATLPKRHPVGMTVPWPGGDNATLFASDAEWISPNLDYAGTAVPSPPAKVILTDSDHICGVCKDGDWVWRSFMNGGNVLFMDVYDGLNEGVGGLGFDPNDPRFVSARRAIGQTRDFADRIALGSMSPRGSLSSTAFALAGGGQMLAYRPASSGNITVNLASLPGPLSVEWLNVDTGVVTTGSNVAGGGTLALTPPFAAPAVVYLRPPTPVELLGFVIE
jgi:hypothetical protein